MVSENNISERAERLRAQAEELVKKEEFIGPGLSYDAARLIEELRIYQAELEIQNEELRDSQGELAGIHEEYVELYYNFAPSAYITLNSAGLITRINLTGVRLLNTDRINLEMTPFRSILDPASRKEYYSTLVMINRTGRMQSAELRLERKGGPDMWVKANIQPDFDDAGKVYQYRLTLTDITLRKQMEKELKESRDLLEKKVRERTSELRKLNEELKKEIRLRKNFEKDLRLKGERILREQERRRYLSGKLVEMLERERRTMAHRLHDEVGQALVTIKTDLDFIKEKKDGCGQEVMDEIEKIQKRIREMMEYFSGLSHTLMPHILGDLGLVPAIENILKNVSEKSHLKVHFYQNDIPLHISEEKDLAIYRIVQEGVTNCLKYAKADNLFINITKKKDTILVTIEDDGRGFDYDAVSKIKGGREKLGISIMNERAVQAGGEFHIESQPGKGTQIIVEIPMG